MPLLHENCRHLRIEISDHTVLFAMAECGDEPVHAEIVRDEQIGNNGDGWLVRGASNFTQTAREIELHMMEDEPWLTASLTGDDGVVRQRHGINLAHHIENQGGQLVWVAPKQDAFE